MQSITEPSLATPTNAARAASGAASDEQSSPAVDFQNFLQLLTAQLRHQDPLSPLDSTQFVAQLASFSTVEQLVNANQSLDDISSSIVNNDIDRFAPWIGKDAEIAGAPAFFDGENPVRFRAEGEPLADRAEAIVTDPTGAERARIPVRNANDAQFWDGAGQTRGAYLINVTYFSGDEIIRTEQANVFEKIGEVRINGGGVELRLRNGESIAPSQIIGLSDFD